MSEAASGEQPEIVTVINLADTAIDALPRPRVKREGHTYRVTYVLRRDAAAELEFAQNVTIEDAGSYYLEYELGD